MLVNGPAPDNPFDAAPDTASRVLLASALHSEGEEEVSAAKVEGALETLQRGYLERRSREVRVQMAEAQRRGDQEMLLRLAQEKVRLDGELKR